MFKPGYSILFVSLALVFTLHLMSAPIGFAEIKPTSRNSEQSMNDSSKFKTLDLKITERSKDRYLLEATLIWKKLPSTRGKDLMSISFWNDGNDYSFIKSTIKAQQTYSAYGYPIGKKKTFQYTLSDEPAQFIVTHTGVAVIQDLKNDWETWNRYFYVYEIKQSIQCELKVEKGNNTSVLVSEAAYLHRVRDEGPLAISNVSLGEKGSSNISIEEPSEKYDHNYHILSQLDREEKK